MWRSPWFGRGTFVPGYQLRVTKSDLAPLELQNPQQGEVLAVVGKNDRGLTLNLKAPLVIHVARRLGRQVVASDDQPVQYELAPAPQPWRKIA